MPPSITFASITFALTDCLLPAATRSPTPSHTSPTRSFPPLFSHPTPPHTIPPHPTPPTTVTPTHPHPPQFLALRLAISLIGLIFLSNSSPSLEICTIILVLCLNREHIDFILWRLYMHAAASPPTEYYTGKRLTKAEFETEGQIETERALAKLAQFLAKNPDELDRVCNHPENLKNGNSTLMDRFVRGHYSGLPRPEAPEESDEGSSWGWFVFKFLAKAGVVGGVAFVLTFLVTKRYA